jgi:general secretion pathway protein A
LTETETEAYIRHRLSVAGMTTAMPFDSKALRRIHHLSRGVPRRINLLCDRSLLGAYSAGKGVVDREIVDKAADEVFDRERNRSLPEKPAGFGRPAMWGVGAAAIAAFVGGTALVMSGALSGSAPASVKAAAGSASGASSGASAPRALAAASAASSATPAFLTVNDLPELFAALTRDEKAAWRQLAPAWKLNLADETDPCAAAQRSQVQCFKIVSSNLGLIRQLDRPGILTLHDANDRPVYAILTGLTNQTATLRIGEISRTVTLVSLATLWRGDFATYWRAPEGYTGRLVDSTSGPIATLVGVQLAKLHGKAASDAPTDAAWKTQVSNFQLSQGLKPDGLAGPTTFMQLNRAAGIDEPRLRGDGGDQHGI